MPLYRFKVSHDGGHIYLSTYGRTEQDARDLICRDQLCPDRCLTLKKVTRTFQVHNTANELKCGYVQTARTERKPGESDVVVKLWHSGGAYHVSIVKDPALNVLWGEDSGKQWYYYSALKDARKIFNALTKLAETF